MTERALKGFGFYVGAGAGAGAGVGVGVGNSGLALRPGAGIGVEWARPRREPGFADPGVGRVPRAACRVPRAAGRLQRAGPSDVRAGAGVRFAAGVGVGVGNSGSVRRRGAGIAVGGGATATRVRICRRVDAAAARGEPGSGCGRGVGSPRCWRRRELRLPCRLRRLFDPGDLARRLIRSVTDQAGERMAGSHPRRGRPSLSWTDHRPGESSIRWNSTWSCQRPSISR